MIGSRSRLMFSLSGASLLLPLPLFAISWLVLVRDLDLALSTIDILLLILIGTTVIDLSVAAVALHLLVGDLSRPSAAAGILLQVVLVWPFLQLSSALSSIMAAEGGLELALGTPLADLLIAILTVILIWAFAVVIPED